MNQENPIDLIGKRVVWQDDGGKTQAAMIDSNLSYGATSVIYKAIALSENSLPVIGEEFAIKVPLPEETRQQEMTGTEEDQMQYEDEFKLLKDIARYQKGRKTGPNVPVAFKGKIAGTGIEPLILEFLDPKNMWAIIKDDAFLKGEILDAVLQALDVIAYMADRDLANLDIKDENFYWFSDQQRFVWLDLNRVVKVSPREREQKIRGCLSKQLAVLYTAYTGREVPNPLPAIEDGESQSGRWVEFPRPLRAALHDASKNPHYSINDLRKTLCWLKDISGLKRENNWDGLVTLAENAKKEILPVNRCIEKMEQVFELIPADSDVQDQIDELRKAVIEILNDNKKEVEENIRTAIQGLKEQKPIASKKILKNILDDPKLPNNETWKWKAAYWYTVAELFDRSRNEISHDTAPKIVEGFEHLYNTQMRENGTKGTAPDILPGTNQDVWKYQTQLTTALELLNKEIPALRVATSPAQKIEKYQSVENRLKTLEKGGGDAGFPRLPEKAIMILRNSLPYVDLKELEKAAEAHNRLLGHEEELNRVKNKLNNIIRETSYGNYPVDQIDQVLLTVQVVDRELEIIKQVHHLIKIDEWLFAFHKLDPIRPEMTLLNQYRAALSTYAGHWVNTFGHRDVDNRYREILHSGTIWEIKKVIEIASTDSRNNYLFSNVKNRLAAADELNPFDEEKLKRLQEARLEPWMLGPDNPQSFSVENLLRLAELSSAEENLKRIKGQYDELVNSLDLENTKINDLIQTREKLDRLTFDLTDVKKSIPEIESTITTVDGLIRTVDKYKKALNTLQGLEETLGKLKRDIESAVSRGVSRIETGENLELILFGALSFILFAAIEYVSHGSFGPAIDLLQDFRREVASTAKRYRESLATVREEIRKYGHDGENGGKETGGEQEQTTWSRTIIDSWIEDLERIHEKTDKGPQYVAIFDALKEKTADNAQAVLNELVSDTGKPLYEYLTDRFRLVFVGTQDELWGLYKEGYLEQVKERVKNLPLHQREEWMERIAHTRNVVAFIRATDTQVKRSVLGFFSNLLNKILGRDMKALATFGETLITPKMYKSASMAIEREKSTQ